MSPGSGDRVRVCLSLRSQLRLMQACTDCTDILKMNLDSWAWLLCGNRVKCKTTDQQQACCDLPCMCFKLLMDQEGRSEELQWYMREHLHLPQTHVLTQTAYVCVLSPHCSAHPKHLACTAYGNTVEAVEEDHVFFDSSQLQCLSESCFEGMCYCLFLTGRLT